MTSPNTANGEARRHAAWLREIGQLRPDNHELWKYLQRRVLDPVPVAQIADELGLDVDALVVWMLSYKGPKRKPYQSRHGSPISTITLRVDGQRSTHAEAQKFASWRHQVVGAQATLAVNGAGDVSAVIPAILIEPREDFRSCSTPRPNGKM